jgi:hypothetical protein
MGTLSGYATTTKYGSSVGETAKDVGDGRQHYHD